MATAAKRDARNDRPSRPPRSQVLAVQDYEADARTRTLDIEGLNVHPPRVVLEATGAFQQRHEKRAEDRAGVGSQSPEA